MKLIERFIEIDAWPTSRKTALVMAMALGSHLIDWLFLHMLVDGSPAFDLASIDLLMAGGALAFLTCMLAGAASAWAGQQGNWTAYLFVLLGGGFFAAMPYVFGMWSAPMFSVIPITVLLAALWYGRNVAITMFGYYLSAIAAIGILQATGSLPYAPGLKMLTVETLRTNIWIVSATIPVLLVFMVAFALSLLVIEARKLQEVRLGDAQKQLQHSNWLISRYVPAQVAQQIMSSSKELPMRHERRRLSIFFSDLVGFTDIAEELEPEDLSRVLNEYFTEMTGIAHRHGGTVDELSGDAILVFFGAPHATDDKDHALRAVRMATEMQQEMVTLNARWRSLGIAETISVRMGISTGVVTVGNFGSPERMKYAVLGKHVNLAARLQTNCQPGNILLSHATWLLIEDQIPCVHKGEMQLKGINKPVMAYEPMKST